MASALNCLPYASQYLTSRKRKSAPQSSSITPAPNLKWKAVSGPVSSSLLSELQRMYWDGVKRELGHMILTLRKWQTPEYTAAILPDEEDDFLHGYDTFVDQVSELSRDFAERYGERVMGWKAGEQIGYEQALRDMGRDIEASAESESLKEEIRDTLAERKRHTIVQRRARMLLQSAGFLDIDKLIEYRPPEELVTFWKRPVAPQLTTEIFDDSYMPFFKPLLCSRCEHTIRGCMFKNSSESTDIICESCYRDHFFRDDRYLKVYKHCVLNDSIGVEDGQNICKCSTVSHIESDGKARALFPVQDKDRHRGCGRQTAIKCGLLNLGTHVAEAKYQGMMSKHEKHVNLEDQKRIDDQRREENRIFLDRMRGLRVEKKQSLVNTANRTAEEGTSMGFEEDEARDDIPFFMRKFVNAYPFGNVHMALRIGPLIIENGVEHVRGALITSRDPPNLQVLRDPGKDIEYSLALNGNVERSLHYQLRTDRKPKRYKTIMKQVVGGAFSGLSNEALEIEIIDALLAESKRNFDMSPSDGERMLQESTDKLLNLLKSLIEQKVEIYLQSLSERLLDPSTNLHWNFRTNNCQTFCDSLLDHDLFGPLVAPPSEQINDSLYLLSFIARPGSYARDPVKTKFDVPSGLIEEYLLKFRYGRHTDSDIIDTLHEYWHDWGSFSSPLYKYGDIFPWDCTEAFGRYPAICNDCNIAKHVWAFPFDSFSLCALHLTRDRHLYPAPDKRQSQLTDQEWFRNRLTILLAQDSLLTVAAAMSKGAGFHAATEWIHQHEDPKMDRLKLGGIHRAQPFSHAFEKGKYHHFFVAEWVHLTEEGKRVAYERLRDGRAKMADVPGVPADIYKNDDGGGCGGCGGPACGGGCGSGCAVSCGGADGGDGGGDGGGCGGCGGCGG